MANKSAAKPFAHLSSHKAYASSIQLNQSTGTSVNTSTQSTISLLPTAIIFIKDIVEVSFNRAVRCLIQALKQHSYHPLVHEN